MNKQWIGIMTAGLVALLTTGGLLADARHFTYSYEADSILPQGKAEYEQWVTHRRGKADGVFSRWDLRQELEYGLTDNLTTAIYLNYKQETSDGVTGKTDANKMKFSGVSSEWKYMVLSPHTNTVGVMAYLETKYSGDEFELEQKLILEHISGPWIFVGNFIFEEEWEYESSGVSTSSVFEFTSGIAYQLDPNWSVGIESRNRLKYNNHFGSQRYSAWFLGPVVSYATEKWWTAVTVLPQITSEYSDLEKFEVRFIAGVYL